MASTPERPRGRRVSGLLVSTVLVVIAVAWFVQKRHCVWCWRATAPFVGVQCTSLIKDGLPLFTYLVYVACLGWLCVYTVVEHYVLPDCLRIYHHIRSVIHVEYAVRAARAELVGLAQSQQEAELKRD